MTWRELEAGAPEIAAVARRRFDETQIGLLATIRSDGWPRISPVEPHVLEGELVFGIMASPKLEDIRSDPRCLLHTPIPDGSGTQPEIKLRGRASATRDPAFLAAEGAWWAERPPESVAVFTLDIEEAVLVAWDTDFGRIRSTRWTRGGQTEEHRRSYP